jgi:hypothetical protein
LSFPFFSASAASSAERLGLASSQGESPSKATAAVVAWPPASSCPAMSSWPAASSSWASVPWACEPAYRGVIAADAPVAASSAMTAAAPNATRGARTGRSASCGRSRSAAETRTISPSKRVARTSGVPMSSLMSAVGPNGSPDVRDTTQTTMTARLTATPSASTERRGRVTMSAAHASWNQPSTRKNPPWAQSSSRWAGAKPKWMAAAPTESAASAHLR